MPGRWEEWKTKPRFSTLPTVPWKSRRHREIFTFPPPRRASHGKVENQKTVSHFPMRRTRRQPRFLSLKPNPKERKSVAARPPHPPYFQDHLVLESNPVSGSFVDWKMLARRPALLDGSSVAPF